MVENLNNLERHRLACKCNGLKYYSADGKLRGEVNEEWWDWDSLSMDDKLEILTIVCNKTEAQRKNPNKVPEIKLMAETLTQYGISCSHPVQVRDYAEWEFQYPGRIGDVPPPSRYFVCQICEERVTEDSVNG